MIHNCDGEITSGGGYVADDANGSAFTEPGDQTDLPLPLGPLGDNGGATFTRVPRAGNAGVDTIPALLCPAGDDQRGATRPQGELCDAGAVEFTPPRGVYLPLVVRP